MEVYIATRITKTPISYGNEIGFESIKLENVTRIDYTTANSVPVYAITHKTGSDADYHISTYPVSDYIVSIMPMSSTTIL